MRLACDAGAGLRLQRVSFESAPPIDATPTGFYMRQRMDITCYHFELRLK